MSPRSLALSLLLVALALATLLGILGHSCGVPTERRRAGARGESSTTAVATAVSETRAFTWPAETGATMEVAQAVMVTVDLDFGPRVPSIAEAVRAVDRRYQPDDGSGRTFAILEAYGEPTAAGKLRLSMHVSSEQPGRSALVFRRSGQVLWHARIRPSTQPAPLSFTGKNLTILLTDEHGNDHVLDGSGVSQSILDAAVRDQGVPLREFWPEGAERQLAFFYSACGCPVKIRCRRLAERALRSTDLPVIFPDDPAVVATISRLLGWGES